MKFQRYLTANRRYCILKILCSAPQEKVNEAVLETALKSLGHGVAYENFLQDLQALESQKLIAIENLDGLLIVHMKRRGRDAAENLIKIDNIHL